MFSIDIKLSVNLFWMNLVLGLFTWPNQDDRMTEIGKHDRKIDNDER